MEHIFNCHGEWLVLFQFLGALPLVGIPFRYWIARRRSTTKKKE